MKTTIASCILAACAAAWNVDLRNSYEESHTIYIKAGETLEVLTDGMAGTGYIWINNLDDYFDFNMENAEASHVQYVE